MNIKIGDTVVTNRFGTAKIEGMLLTAGRNINSGDEIKVVGIESVHAGKVVFDLDNGHWVWSHQVLSINGVKVAA